MEENITVEVKSTVIACCREFPVIDGKINIPWGGVFRVPPAPDPPEVTFSLGSDEATVVVIEDIATKHRDWGVMLFKIVHTFKYKKK